MVIWTNKRRGLEKAVFMSKCRLFFVHPMLEFHVCRSVPACCHHLFMKHAWAKQGCPFAPRTMPDDTCLGFSIVKPVWKPIWCPSPLCAMVNHRLLPCWGSVHTTTVSHAMLEFTPFPPRHCRFDSPPLRKNCAAAARVSSTPQPTSHKASTFVRSIPALCAASRCFTLFVSPLTVRLACAL